MYKLVGPVYSTDRWLFIIIFIYCVCFFGGTLAYSLLNAIRLKPVVLRYCQHMEYVNVIVTELYYMINDRCSLFCNPQASAFIDV